MTSIQNLQKLWRGRSKWVVCAVALLGVMWIAAQTSRQTSSPSMARWMPAGAMLYLESPDFKGLLRDWSTSPEKRAWLSSDNYAVFSRSHLFGRLGDAQHEFAASAGLPPDMQFLTQVAGKKSALGLYDIGRLEFLYITQMSSADALNTPLLQERSKFETRKAGNVTFYVRNLAPGKLTPVAGQDADPSEADAGGISTEGRTVAFAVSGDYLLLATREDILANALELMQGGKTETVAGDTWFADATSAAGEPGALRMVLDLSRIVPSPYFRSYWIQQNITEMSHYRAALSDLYREVSEFHEERVLLPKTTPDAVQADLAPLVALIPPGSGAYRAVASPSTEEIIDRMDERLLSHKMSPYRDRYLAPDEPTTATAAGNADDVETRIDAPPPVALKAGAELEALRQLIQKQQPQGMLAVDTSQQQSGHVFVGFHSAIVLSSRNPWEAHAMEEALQQALQPKLTAGNLGLAWRTQGEASAPYLQLDGLHPMQLAVTGNICILANDPNLLTAILQQVKTPAAAAQQAVYIAGFNHAAERQNFVPATSAIERSGSESRESNEPLLFSKNVASLSKAFAGLQTMQITDFWRENTLHQIIYYRWSSH